MSVDEHALAGAHVTLWTGLQHTTAGDGLEVILLHDGLSEKQLEGLEHTIRSRIPAGVLRPVRIDVTRFRGLKWISGLMTYARFLLPEMVDSPRLLYLDADLLAFTDLSEPFGFELGGHALGAVPVTSHARSNDWPLFSGLGLKGSNPHFNAGVLLFDVELWRSAALGERCISFAHDHPVLFIDWRLSWQ